MATQSIVYTAITGKYDELLERRQLFGNVEQYIYTDDQSMDTGPWVKLPAISTQNDLPPRLSARYHKCNAHLLPDHGISIWVDGTVKFRNIHLAEHLIGELGDKDILVTKHPARKTLAEEMQALKDLRKYPLEMIESHEQYYLSYGYDLNNTPIYSNGLVVRRNTKSISEFNQDWYNINAKYGPLDQIAMAFVIYDLDMDVAVLDKPARDNGYVSIGSRPHKVKHIKQPL